MILHLLRLYSCTGNRPYVSLASVPAPSGESLGPRLTSSRRCHSAFRTVSDKKLEGKPGLDASFC